MIATHTRTRTHIHTHISSSIANLTASWYFIKIKNSEPNISAPASVTVGIRCSSAGGYQTALHCCGRPFLDWGWTACIRREASCTEPRCLYRDGSGRIHVPCHPYCVYIFIKVTTEAVCLVVCCITYWYSRFYHQLDSYWICLALQFRLAKQMCFLIKG